MRLRIHSQRGKAVKMHELSFDRSQGFKITFVCIKNVSYKITVLINLSALFFALLSLMSSLFLA
jgi:hypothetical protein